MKRNLLDLTQSILSSLSSDEVNSISDTTESLQVAEAIRTTYFNIITRIGLTKNTQLIQLNPSLDASTPVLMYVPDGTSRIEWLKYFNSSIRATTNTSSHGINVDITPTSTSVGTAVPGYEDVIILPISQFIDMVTSFNPSESNVESFTFQDNSNNFNTSYTFYYKNDKQPQYCAVLSNYYVIFDSYDKTQDDTLQASKTMLMAEVIPVFKMEDSFIPDLEEEQFPLLLNEAKALAFFELKQSPHPKAEMEAKRGWSSIQKDEAIINKPSYFDALPDFGRRGYSGQSFFKRMGWRR